VRHRMTVALLSLLGLLVSCYLLLYKLGLVGELACGASGSCERVQASSYAVLLGIPIAAYGVGGYLALMVVALAGLEGRWADHPGPTRLLAALSAIGVLFAAYLTYLEVAVIHDICRWCVVSAVLITAILCVSLAGLRAQRSSGHQRS